MYIILAFDSHGSELWKWKQSDKFLIFILCFHVLCSHRHILKRLPQFVSQSVSFGGAVRQP